MGISINPELESRLRERAKAEGVSLEAYVERVLVAEERAEAELESLALEGLRSGEPIEPTADFWGTKHRLLDERMKQTSTR